MYTLKKNCNKCPTAITLRREVEDFESREDRLIRDLKVMGFKNFDGDASVQVLIQLKDGRYLRIGITDDDVADRPGLWCDFYGRWDNG